MQNNQINTTQFCPNLFKIVKYVYIITFVLLAGCTTSKTALIFSEITRPEIKADKALLYIFRDYAEPTAFASHLEIDKIEATSLNQEGFTWVYIEPGKRHFKFGWSFLSGMPSVEFEKQLEGGKVYAFQMSGNVRSTGVMINLTSAIIPTNIEDANKIMKKCCRYVPSSYNNKSQ